MRLSWPAPQLGPQLASESYREDEISILTKDLAIQKKMTMHAPYIKKIQTEAGISVVSVGQSSLTIKT